MGNIRSGMRVGFNVKVLAERQSDIDALKAMTQDIFIKQQNNLALKKSIRVLSWNIKSGYDGDDFVKNMITIVFTGKGYRIPRIIKRLYK